MQLDRAIAHYGCAAITFYFAYMEVVMDVLFPFLDKQPADFLDFRSRSWDERFKETFPVADDKALKGIYDGLLDFGRRIRGVVVHGYSGEEGILIPLRGIGLVPISYMSLLTAPQFEISAIDPDEASSALELFDSMDKWLQTSTPYKYVVRYADVNDEIPFVKEKVERIKAEMKTMEEFEEFLRDKARARTSGQSNASSLRPLRQPHVWHIRLPTNDLETIRRRFIDIPHFGPILVDPDLTGNGNLTHRLYLSSCRLPISFDLDA